MQENDSVMKKLKITEMKSKCFCPSLLIKTNLFVNTKAYPLISLGTTPSKFNFPLTGWEAAKIC